MMVIEMGEKGPGTIWKSLSSEDPGTVKGNSICNLVTCTQDAGYQ